MLTYRATYADVTSYVSTRTALRMPTYLATYADVPRLGARHVAHDPRMEGVTQFVRQRAHVLQGALTESG
jgi:hypothetical protein